MKQGDVNGRRILGLVPQSLALYEQFSAVANLEVFGKIYDIPKKQVEEKIKYWLAKVQLWDRRKDKVKGFSGGMKRRLNLVASLLHDPEILLCDGPTVGVDPLVELITEFWGVPEEEVRSLFREDSFVPDFRKIVDQWDEADEPAENAGGSDEAESQNLFGQLMDVEKEQLVGTEIKNPTGVQVVGGYSVMFLLFTLTGMARSLFEEKQAGIFLRLLSSPVIRAHILWSKYLFGVFLGMIQLVTVFLFSWILFRVEIFNHFGNLLVALLFVSAACTSFGMLIASISKTPAQANGIGTLTIIAMSAIGGAWFPVSFMAESVQIFSRLTVVYGSVEAIMLVMFEGKNLIQLLPVLGVLTLISMLVLVVSLWRFKKGDLF